MNSPSVGNKDNCQFTSTKASLKSPKIIVNGNPEKDRKTPKSVKQKIGSPPLKNLNKQNKLLIPQATGQKLASKSPK